MKEFNHFITLLEDEDYNISSIVIEQLLSNDKFIKNILPVLQDSNNEVLRKRSHQMQSILQKKERFANFIKDIQEQKLSLLDSILFFNEMIDASFSRKRALTKISLYKSSFAKKNTSITGFMSKMSYSVSSDNISLNDLLLTDIFEDQKAHSLLLVFLAQEIAAEKSYKICFFKGHNALLIDDSHVADPLDNWQIKEVSAKSYVVCSNERYFLQLVNLSYSCALIEGNLNDIYHIGKILTSLIGCKFSDQVYPIGNKV